MTYGSTPAPLHGFPDGHFGVNTLELEAGEYIRGATLQGSSYNNYIGSLQFVTNTRTAPAMTSSQPLDSAGPVSASPACVPPAGYLTRLVSLSGQTWTIETGTFLRSLRFVWATEGEPT